MTKFNEAATRAKARRSVEAMTEAEKDAYCEGLVELLRRINERVRQGPVSTYVPPEIRYERSA